MSHCLVACSRALAFGWKPLLNPAAVFMLAWGIVLVPSLAAVAAEDKQALAGKAQAILKANCYRCHGEAGNNEGGVNFILDVPTLVVRKKLVPGDPTKSKLYVRMTATEADQQMPPPEETVRPSKEDLTVIRQWIEAGAPDFYPPIAKREFLSPSDVLTFLRDDLRKANPRDRRFLRYFTLTHLSNAGFKDDDLQSYRVGLSKLINSLSWGQRIVLPQAIDPARTVFRIDLRDYKWTEKIWDSVTRADPYAITYTTSVAKECYAATGCQLPHVRGDWFVFAASRPPLYHDILQLPKTDRELETLLRVDVAEDIRQEIVVRAGFNGSGVSQNNRMIERHKTFYGGYYWKSYDFANSLGRKNLFNHPLGPGEGENTFQHDGGEIIWALPNSVQAYMLVDSRGNRIDTGPTAIVVDKDRVKKGLNPDVINGISCMSCHAKGLIDKTDQIRESVEKNPRAFGAQEREIILALYPTKDKLESLLKEDIERFARAVAQTGARLSTTEPIAALATRFEEEVDLNLAAAEVGVSPPLLINAIQHSVKLARVLGPLQVDGGTVKREVFASAFGDLVAEMKLGLVNRPKPDDKKGIQDERPLGQKALVKLSDAGGETDMVVDDNGIKLFNVRLQDGTRVTILARKAEQAKIFWNDPKHGEQTGWVNSKILRIEEIKK